MSENHCDFWSPLSVSLRGKAKDLHRQVGSSGASGDVNADRGSWRRLLSWGDPWMVHNPPR